MVLTKKLCWCLIVLAQACLLTGVYPSAVFASNPEVVTIMPPGVQRGKTTEVTIGGARLADAKQLLFFTPGVVVESIKAIDEANVKATISVPADCACDLHAFRLVTETGISNLRYLGIGSMPIVDEVEPNSDFAKPQLIESNVTIHGIIKAEDVDYFAIDLKKGEPLTIEIEGLRLSYLNNFFDPFVAVLDSRRFELARSDDFPLVYQDGICSFEAPEDGRYTIEIRESSYGGSDRSVYRAHIGRFPRPVAIHPAGGSPGETLQVTCVDGKGTVWKESITIPTEVDKEFKFWSQRDGLVSPSPNFLRVRPYANVQESPENDDPNKISVSETLPAAFHGILEKKDDQDWFGFQAKKDQTLDIKVFARGTLRSPVDSLLTIRKIGGGQVGANDDSGGPDSYVSFKVPEDGKYAVGIRDHLGEGSPQHIYRIEVTPQEASVAATVNELERYVSQVINVPAGARMAVEASLVRKNVGGDGQLQIPDLPPGLTLSETLVPKDQSTVPLMIRAASDSAPHGKLVDVIASVKPNADAQFTGQLEQRTQILRGRNNVDVWGYMGKKLAVAITSPAPFDIEVEQPKVPLVRRGSMDLVVKAKRKEGFDKPISLRLLTNPPGVGASASIAIPGDKSQASIPLTANDNAALKSTPITVLATYDSGRGPITIASEFVTLEVADSLFDFQFQKTVADQGKSAMILIGLKAKRPFEGVAEFEVLGLPPGTSSEQPKIKYSEGLERLEFPLTIPAQTRQGNYKTIVCRAVVTSDKGTIVQTNGNGEVQVDVPLPTASAAAPSAPTPTAAAPAAVAKPLSRLEQLRKMKEESATEKKQ